MTADSLADDGDQSRPVLSNMSEFATVQDITLPMVGVLSESMEKLRAALGRCPHCGR